MDSLFACILDAVQRAPSAHNTQPWKVQWHKEGLNIFISQDRMIPAIDPMNDDVLHAVGAVIENVQLTLGHLGYETQYEVAERISHQHPIVTLNWKKSHQPFLEKELFYQIPLRRTSRLPYRRGAVEENAFLKMQRYLLAPCKVYWTQDTNKLMSIRKLVASATVHQIKDQRIAAELYEWTRFSSGDPRWHRDGLNAACMGWKRLESMIYKHLLHPKILAAFSRNPIFDKLYYSERQSAPFSPAVILLTLPTVNNPYHRVLAGRSLQRLWLAASHEGLSTHPISAGVDVPLTCAQVKTLLGVPSTELHVNLFRLGMSESCARSPRLTVDEMVVRSE